MEKRTQKQTHAAIAIVFFTNVSKIYNEEKTPSSTNDAGKTG
jgi:hypothetical protein